MFRKRNLQFVSTHHIQQQYITMEWNFFFTFTLAPHPSFFFSHSFLTQSVCSKLHNDEIRLDTGRWQNYDDISVRKNEQELFVRNIYKYCVYGRKILYFQTRYESSYVIMGANETLSDFSGDNIRCIVHTLFIIIFFFFAALLTHPAK